MKNLEENKVGQYIKTVKITACYTTFEPGDKTRYTFIISESPDNNKDYIMLGTGICGVVLNTYALEKASIISFFQNVGDPPEYKEDYYDWAYKNKAFENDYFSYVLSHTGNNNIWTVLAGLVCAYKYILGSLK